jgi:hypothetical protein
LNCSVVHFERIAETTSGGKRKGYENLRFLDIEYNNGLVPCICSVLLYLHKKAFFMPKGQHVRD